MTEDKTEKKKIYREEAEKIIEPTKKKAATNLQWDDVMQTRLQDTMLRIIDGPDNGTSAKNSGMDDLFTLLKNMSMFKMLGNLDLSTMFSGSPRKEPENDDLRKELNRLKEELQLQALARQEDRVKALQDELRDLKRGGDGAENKSLTRMETELANLTKELQASKEETMRAEIAGLKESMSTQIQALGDRVSYRGSEPAPSSPIEMVRKQVADVKELGNIFGQDRDHSPGKEMSAAETVEFGLNLIPKAAEGIQSISSILHPKEPEDDIAPDSPPARTAPTVARPQSPPSSLPSDVARYINEGIEVRDGPVASWTDKYGNMFLNDDGNLMDKTDILRVARTMPEQFRADMKKNIELGEKRTIIPAKPAAEEPAPAMFPIPPGGIKVKPKTALPKEIQDYIDAHREDTIEIDGTPDVLVGDYEEFWQDEDTHKPMSPVELEAKLKSIPADKALEYFHNIRAMAKEEYEKIKHEAESTEPEDPEKPETDQEG